MSERPRILEQLQVEFDRAARRTLAPRRARLAGRLALRPLSAVATIAGVLALAAAAAAAILIAIGSPLAPAHTQDLLSSGVPLAGSVRLAGLDAADPEAGQPPWDIRLSRTRAGETCTAVGQVFAGKFGIVGLDHVFRALPLGGVDTCGYDSPHGPLLAGAHAFAGRNAAGARTVLNGIAGSNTRSVTAYGPGGARSLALGPDGSFITVYRGYPEEVHPRVTVVSRDGVTRTLAFAQSSLYEAADPQGGASWQITGGADLNLGAYPDEDCAQASRQLDEESPSLLDAPQLPPVCGRLGQNPLLVSMRRFDPDSGQGSGYPWGDNPARTIVYGIAAPRVSSLSLSGDGATRRIAIGRPDGVFLAVLDGHVDPRSLTLSARMHDGSGVAYRGSANLLSFQTNTPVPAAPVEPYRSPSPARTATFVPFETPISGSVRETLRMRDPAGGAEWVLRSWRGRPTAGMAAKGAPANNVVLCFQVGVMRAGVLSEPGFPATARPLSISPAVPGEEGRCNSRSELVSHGPRYSTEAFLDDPYAYAPKPQRVLVSGQLPPAATHPLLLGAGAPRALLVDPNDAFMALLPGRYWDAWLHVAYTLHGAHIGLHANAGSGFPRTPQARAPDPDGAAPWGFAVSRSGAVWVGNIVDGQLADVSERNGTVLDAPVLSGGYDLERTAGQQLLFDVQQVSPQPASAASTPVLSPPQIERRTLPGRTIVTGIANADVASVTLMTPSDVRTLRPAGPRHVLIAVYDGVVHAGRATATIQLRDGRTLTEALPAGPGTFTGTGPPRTSIERNLQLIEESLRREANPRRPSRDLPQTERELGVLRRRIAYERAHPGVLPGG